MDETVDLCGLLGAQQMTPHSVEVIRVSYALQHAAHKWLNLQRLNKWDFIFDRFSKVKAPKDFFVLEEGACLIY